MTGSIPVDDVSERVPQRREAHAEFRRALEEVARLRSQLVRAEQRLTVARSSLVGAQDDVESLGGATAAGGEIDVIDELAQQRPA